MNQIDDDAAKESRKYPRFPRVGVGAVVIKEGKILLVKRAFEPGQGKWSVPGGMVELGEKLADACVRELEEETGIKGQALELINAFDMIVSDEGGRTMYHYVLIDFLVKPVGGAEMPNQEVLEMRWASYEESKHLDMTNSARRALQELFEGTGH